MSEKVTCQICGEQVHSVQIHIRDSHPDWTIEQYKEMYPDAPLLSDLAKQKLLERKKAKAATTAAMAGTGAALAAKVTSLDEARGYVTRNMHEVFGLGEVPAAMNMRGNPIPVTVMTNAGDYADLVPIKDDGYIFNIELLKTVLMGLELNIPVYLWGHAGTGKTTMLEQVCAFTGRPFMRVQHTVNTEEYHILGQWTARDGRTAFELGPLPVAMKYGLVYCGDEYDRATPGVLSVYQPVLEGKPLVIKEADAENRVIRPHPNFRFVATGNSNGAGDETGLYQSTIMGDSSNYERFGIVEEVKYMPETQEIGVLMNKARIKKAEAEKFVRFANDIRRMYEAERKIGAPISPRALINAAKIGLRRGDWRLGLNQAYSNRLTRVDREVVNQVAQRIFG